MSREAYSKCLPLMFALGTGMASVLTGATYYVRPLGNDAACTGLTDADYQGNQDCAFASPQKALDTMACVNGDDVTIRAGTYSPAPGTLRFSLKPYCAPSAGSPDQTIVIQGEANRTLTILDAGATDDGALYSPGGGSSTRSSNIQVKNLHIKPGRYYGVRLDGEHANFLMDNCLYDDMPNLCCSDNAQAVVVYVGGPSGGCSGCTFTNNLMNGSPNTTINGVTGTNAQAFRNNGLSAAPATSRFANNTINYLLGSSFGGNLTQTIIENNTIKGTTCFGDDGCVQVYNSVNAVVRCNLWTETVPLDQGGRPVITVRSTNETDPTKHSNAVVYNNTFVGKPGTALDQTKTAFWINPEIHPGSPATKFVNNIVMKGFGKDFAYPSGGACQVLQPAYDRYTILVDDCSDNLAFVDYNLTWQVGQCTEPPNTFWDSALSQKINTTDCPITSTHNKFGVNPSLNSNYEPYVSNAPPCGAGTTSVVAFDGDQSKSYIGAKKGACGPCPRCQVQYCTGVEIGCQATGICGIGCCYYQCGVEIPSCVEPECPPNVCGGCGGW